MAWFDTVRSELRARLGVAGGVGWFAAGIVVWIGAILGSQSGRAHRVTAASLAPHPPGAPDRIVTGVTVFAPNRRDQSPARQEGTDRRKKK